MARARNIKPGFFTNGDLLECQPLARLLFAGLWCEADRRGILEDRPKTLKVKILPGDNCDVEELIEELSVRGFVVRYQVGETRCLYLPGFGKHQNPHVKETENTLPAPDGFVSSTVKAPVKNSVNRADSLIPHTDSLNPKPPKSPKGDQYSAEFENDFWAHYPKGRGSKQAAFKLWEKLTEAERADARDALPKFKAGSDWTRGFHSAPEVWLRGRMWENPPAQTITTNPNGMPPEIARLQWNNAERIKWEYNHRVQAS